MLIGISGYAQCGKDTICEILRHHGIIKNRYAFADPIKKTCNALFDWDDRHAFGDLKEVEVEVPFTLIDANSEAFYAQIVHFGLDQFGVSPEHIKNLLIDEICFTNAPSSGEEFPETIKLSPRLVYQLFGTEIGRNKLHTDVWVQVAPTENTAIPDVRFPNEAEWLHSVGGTIIRVSKDDATPVRPHVSESFIETLPADLELDNNGTLYDLETQIIEYFDCDGSRLHEETEIQTARRIIKQCADIQCSPGNYDYDPYMHGMANGLLRALGIVNGQDEVDFLEAPEEWLRDNDDAPTGDELQMYGVLVEGVDLGDMDAQQVADFELTGVSLVVNPEPGCEIKDGE